MYLSIYLRIINYIHFIEEIIHHRPVSFAQTTLRRPYWGKWPSRYQAIEIYSD